MNPSSSPYKTPKLDPVPCKTPKLDISICPRPKLRDHSTPLSLLYFLPHVQPRSQAQNPFVKSAEFTGHHLLPP